MTQSGAISYPIFKWPALVLFAFLSSHFHTLTTPYTLTLPWRRMEWLFCDQVWLTQAGCSRGFWVWNVRCTGGGSWKWYINQPFLKLYFDRITIVFHVHIVCVIKSKYTTINNSANYLQTYVLILFLYGETPNCPYFKVSSRGCFVHKSAWCCHQGLLNRCLELVCVRPHETLHPHFED